jgi:hypothetical protein
MIIVHHLKLIQFINYFSLDNKVLGIYFVLMNKYQ